MSDPSPEELRPSENGRHRGSLAAIDDQQGSLPKLQPSDRRGTQDQPLAGAESTDLPVLLTTAEVAGLLRVDRSTLSRWRAHGTGPQVTWLTPTIPRYQRAHVLDWIQRGAA
jgi:hypothetical protein